MHFKPMICAMLLPVFSLALFFPAPAFAQLTPVNESGVTVGHVHLLVPDPEAHKKLWIDLFGAQVAKTGSLEFLKLPGIVLLIGKGQPADAVGEPTADHFALVVRDLAAAKIKLAAAKIPMPDDSGNFIPNSASSQFAILLLPILTASEQQTIFGTVIEGMDVVSRLRRVDPHKEK